MIDSTCVRVHQHAATGKRGMENDGGVGRSRADLRAKSLGLFLTREILERPGSLGLFGLDQQRLVTVLNPPPPLNLLQCNTTF